MTSAVGGTTGAIVASSSGVATTAPASGGVAPGCVAGTVAVLEDPVGGSEDAGCSVERDAGATAATVAVGSLADGPSVAIPGPHLPTAATSNSSKVKTPIRATGLRPRRRRPA
ncbi:MAG: hypothetical protein M3Q29_21315 [Chloroflexota bacterium]|nr:hypothetical protein [Chloroflexota bacterium]